MQGEAGPQGVQGVAGADGLNGTDGANGLPGADGSDANVTSTNINLALGYTPVAPADLSSKQDALVSGTNIKSINGTSLVGSGDLVISGGGSALTVKDEGVNKSVATQSINFTGAGVTATNVGDDITVDVPIPTVFPSNISIGIANAMFGVGPNSTDKKRNVCIGHSAIGILAGGSSNVGTQIVAIGYNTLNKLGANSGNNTISIGANALMNITSSSGNTVVGDTAMFNATSTNWNTAIGFNASLNITTGSKNTSVGATAGKDILTYSNTSCFGYGTTVSGDNQVQLGDSLTTTYVYGTVQNRSDIRDKAEVRDTTLGLDFILNLRPVDYKWNLREDYTERKIIEVEKEITKEDGTTEIIKEHEFETITLPMDGSKTRTRYHHGFIAQDFVNSNFGGFQDHSRNGGKDVMSIGYDEFIAPLVKAIQEQQLIIESMKVEIDLLKNR